MANLMMPSLVELNDIATEKFPDQEETVANISAGIYNTTSAVGYLIAPIYGSAMEDQFGFRLTMDATVCIDLVFAIAYLFFGGGV